MKKISFYVTAILLLVFFTLGMSSCKKGNEPHTCAYSDTFNYQFTVVPDTLNGYDPEIGLPAWFNNLGTGTSNVLPNATIFFTVYAKFNSAGTGVDNISIPVNKFYEAQLAAAGLHVPDAVEQIVYDDHQNSIWFKAISRTTAQTGPTTIETTGELIIIDGTGKFHGATGHVSEDGRFNPQTGEGVIGHRGTITY